MICSPCKIEEDEHINSKVYAGFKDFSYLKSKNCFVPMESNSNSQQVANIEESIEKIEKRRYFISLMSESLIKKGVFFRLRKRIRVIFSILLYFPFSYYF